VQVHTEKYLDSLKSSLVVAQIAEVSSCGWICFQHLVKKPLVVRSLHLLCALILRYSMPNFKDLPNSEIGY